MGNTIGNQTPSVRPVQFEGNSDDIFKDSVNLFRGDVNLSLDLVSLRGRNGLDVKVTAFYGSNVKNIINETNEKSPVDIMGLGWSLPFERIEVEARDNSSSNDDIYFMYSNNSSIELVRSNKKWCRAILDIQLSSILDQGKVDTHIQEGFAQSGLVLSGDSLVNVIKSNTLWEIIDKKNRCIYTVERQDSMLAVMAGGDGFECFQYDFSQIRYYPLFERWEIVKDDGTTFFYGGLTYSDTSSNQNTIQWKVAWGNWSGESNVTVSKDGTVLQSRRPIAWNLASTENIWGDKIQFSYDTVEQQVGKGGLSFTKACYLSEITDMLNRTISFNYEEKEYIPDIPSGPREYGAPNWNEPYKRKPDNSPSPYQNRYKTRFLKSIDVCNEYGDLLYSVCLDYDNTSNFSRYSTDNYLYGDTVKRTLVGIRRVFANSCSKPGLKLMYWKAGSVNPGALSGAILPEGAKVEYQYKEQELPLCDRQIVISNPWPGSSKPRVWFGTDYVFTVWFNESTDELKVVLYTWLGRWQEWLPQESIIKAPLDIDSLNVITGEDFACLTYSLIREQKSFVHIFHKNSMVWGDWYEDDKLNINSTSLCVGAGDNFFVACDQENRVLYRYTWNSFSKKWIKEDISSALSPGEPNSHPYITAANKYYAILDYGPLIGGEHKSKLDIYYQDNMYCWNKGGSKDFTFTIGGNKPETSFGFTASSSFIALTYITNEVSLKFNYTVKVISWDNSYNNVVDQDFLYSLPKSNPSKVITIPFLARIVDNSMIASGPYLLRYNGERWLENNGLNFRADCADTDIFWYAYGKNYAICTINRDYACDSKLLDFDPCTNSEEWNSSPAILLEKDDFTNNRKSRFFPTAGINIATMDNRIYHRGTQCSWSKAIESYEEISSVINSTTMINQGPRFLAYLNLQGETPKSSSLWPFINQELGEEDIINQRFFTQVDNNGMLKPNTNGQYPSGPSTFVTYLPIEKDFDDAESITLHRFLDNSLEGKVLDYCVDSMTINDGYQSSTTKYCFDINLAACDPSGAVVKYYRSLCYTGTQSIDNPKYGYMENTYFNGLTDKNLLETDFKAQGELYSQKASGLLDGQLIRRRVYRADGKILIDEIKQFKTYTSIISGGNVSDLFGGYFRCTENQLIEDGLQKTTFYEYEESFGKLKEERFDYMDAKGETYNVSKKYAYAYEAYRWFLERNVIDAYLGQYDCVIPPGSKRSITGASLQTYKPYNMKLDGFNSGGIAVWSTFESYVLSEEVPDCDLDFKNITKNKPGDQWQLVNTVLKRTNNGVICQQQDVFQKIETTIYDKNDVLSIAVFRHGVDNECDYTGFEMYENYEAQWSIPGKDIRRTIIEGDAQTGECSLKLDPAMTMEKSTSLRQDQTVVLSSWIKVQKGFTHEEGSVYWKVTDGLGSVEKIEIVPQMEGKWVYWQGVIDFSGKETRTLSLSLTNEKKSKYIMLNDICFSPLISEIEVKAYDTVYKDEIAKIGANGDIVRSIYDPFRQKCGEIGPWESVKKGTIAYYNTQWICDSAYDFPQNDPNSVCTIAASNGGMYETFTKGDEIWDEWDTGIKNTWEIQKGKLKHSGDTESMITWLSTKDQNMYGAGFSVTASHDKKVSFGIFIGDNINVKWSFHEGWTMELGGKTFSDGDKSIKMPVNFLLIPICGTVYVFADGRQVFAQKTDLNILGALSLSAKGDICFSNIITYFGPQVSMDYKDGYGKVVQQQVVCDNNCLVKGKIYNELALQVIETKIAGFENTFLGYRPDFVRSINWVSGLMEGEVSDYYPKDEGYPYNRNEYEKSTLGRIVRKGFPGKEFAITDSNCHITEMKYGIEDKASIAKIPFVAGSYIVNLVTDADGAQIYELKDKLGRILGKQTDSKEDEGKILEAVQQVYDGAGNLIKILHPNYFNTNENSEDFSTIKAYNFLKQLTYIKTTDSGETKFVYDKAGLMRFSVNPLSTTSGNILYKKYDILGRITEEGWFEGEWGDGTDLQKIAYTDPEYPHNNTWAKRNEYDGAGNDFTLRGRLWRAYSSSKGNGIVDVENYYGYDLYGNTVLSGLIIKDQGEQITRYSYNNLGHVTEVEYPTCASLSKVVYQYNSLGQNVSIGTPEQPGIFSSYSYNADGSLACEKLNSFGARPLKRDFYYNSPGWIEGIVSEYVDENLIFNQRFWYTSDGYNGSSYYNGNIAKVSNENGIVKDNSFDYSYKYDSRGQLEVAEHSKNSEFSIGVSSPTTFDPNGNILTIGMGECINTYQYGSNTNRVIAIEKAGEVSRFYEYDKQGNIISSSNCKIQKINYNILTNLPEKVDINEKSSLEIAYIYNSINQRVLKTRSDGSTKLYVHGLNDTPLIEKEGGVVQYIYGVGGLIAIIKDGKTFFVIKDQQGSVRVVAQEDGKIEAMMDYLPFGELLPNTYGNPDIISYRFTGQEFETDLDLYNYRARLYDPQLGRFYSVDPEFQYGSPYAYCGNNPVNLTDPSGEEIALATFLTILAIGAAIGALTGGGAAAYTGYKEGLRGGSLCGYTFAGIGLGAVTGALSAAGGVGAFAVGSAAAAATATTAAGIAAGVAAGAGTGAVIGAGIGAAQGVSQHFINDAFGVKNTGSWGQSMLRGAILGAVGGAVSGAAAGYGGAQAAFQSIKFAQLGCRNMTFSYRSLTQVSEAYYNFSSMGVVPLPSFVSRIPNVKIPVVGGLQSFTLAKFSLPTLSSGIGAAAKEIVGLALPSPKQTEYKKVPVQQSYLPTDYYCQKAFNPSMSSSVGMSLEVLPITSER